MTFDSEGRQPRDLQGQAQKRVWTMFFQIEHAFAWSGCGQINNVGSEMPNWEQLAHLHLLANLQALLVLAWDQHTILHLKAQACVRLSLQPSGAVSQNPN